MNLNLLDGLVKQMYRDVAEQPGILDRLPSGAVESFAGVGYVFALAGLKDGGAAQIDTYRKAIEASGLRIERMRRNDYRFRFERARRACSRYGVMSISLLAEKSKEATS